MPHSSATARRAVVALTTAALAGGALVAGGGAASAAPGDPDLSGAVVNSAGVPLANIDVVAFTTPADGSAPESVDFATTDAAGRYTFTGLDAETIAGYGDPAITGETEFKLYFSWSPTVAADYHSPGYLDRGLGGSKTIRGAGSVVVPAGAAATAPNMVLPTAGGVILAVKGKTGAPINYDATGGIQVAGAANPFDSAVPYLGGYLEYDDDAYPDPAAAPADGLVYLLGVEPGDDYAVSATGADRDPVTNVVKSYLSRFFGGDGTYPDAKAVKVTAGQFTNVAIQLSDVLTTVQKPRILGNSSIGSKLKADPGTWLQQQGNDFTYQWLRGSTPVATGDTYKLTKKDKGKKIKLAVTAYSSDTNGPGFVGSAVAAPTSKVGEKSKVTVTKRNADGSLSVKVVVAKSKLAKKLGTPQGKVVLVTEDGENASKKVKLKNGVATLKPRAKYAGEKLTVVYLGGGKLGSDTVAAGGKGGKGKDKGGKGDKGDK